MALRLTVNGRVHTVDVDPATPLLYVLENPSTIRSRDLVNIEPGKIDVQTGTHSEQGKIIDLFRKALQSGAPVTDIQRLNLYAAIPAGSFCRHF